MPIFEDLPIEIVREIINMSAPVNATADPNSLCKLRLVSRNLNALVSPVLFEELRLGFADADEEIAPDCMRCQEIIVALATRSTQAYENTKRLFFCTQTLYWTLESWRTGVTEVREIVAQKMFDAISALKDLRTIRYICNPNYDPEQLTMGVIRALATLPSFQGFEQLCLLQNPPASFTLQPLSNLTIVKAFWSWESPEHFLAEISSLFARCPNISEIYLHVGSSTPGLDVTFGEIFGKVYKMGSPLKIRRLQTRGVLAAPDDFNDLAQHLGQLEFLEITQARGKTPLATLSPIYDILRQRNIYLKGLTTDTASDPSLLSYLASYSGLIDLRVFTEAEDPRTTDQICSVILPKHRDTLEKLVLCPTTSEALFWSTFPTDEQLSGLLQCKRLRTLEVYHGTKPNQLEWDGITIFDRWLQVGLQLPNLMHLELRALFELWQDLSAVSAMREEVIKRFREEYSMKFRVNKTP